MRPAREQRIVNFTDIPGIRRGSLVEKAGNRAFLGNPLDGLAQQLGGRQDADIGTAPDSLGWRDRIRDDKPLECRPANTGDSAARRLGLATSSPVDESARCDRRRWIPAARCASASRKCSGGTSLSRSISVGTGPSRAIVRS